MLLCKYNLVYALRSIHRVTCLHDTVEAVPQTQGRTTSLNSTTQVDLSGSRDKISAAFLQTGCPFTHATNSVKALKEAILSPGPYNK